MTSVNAVGMGADATDERDNTFWDVNTDHPAKDSMLPQNKIAIEMIFLLAMVKCKVVSSTLSMSLYKRALHGLC